MQWHSTYIYVREFFQSDISLCSVHLYIYVLYNVVEPWKIEEHKDTFRKYKRRRRIRFPTAQRTEK